MRSSWTTAILLGLVAVTGSATATVITPVSTVLNAHARSSGGDVVAAPLIVGAIYGQFSISAESKDEWWPWWGDRAGATILVTIQPDELRLSGTSGASGTPGFTEAGASALVKFEVETSSEWLLHVEGFDSNPWGRVPYLQLSDSSGTVYLFDGGNYARWEVQLTLDPRLYSLEARVGTGDYYQRGSSDYLQASLRPVPSVVPIPATFGTPGPDLLVSGLICLFVVLRPAWHRTRGTQPRLRAAQVASPAGWVGHRQQ